MHPHGVRMAKRAVNAMLDAQGQHQALDFGFQTCSLGYANAWIVTGWPIMANLDEMKSTGKSKDK
jgi:enoyl-CoA hydratase